MLGFCFVFHAQSTSNVISGQEMAKKKKEKKKMKRRRRKKKKKKKKKKNQNKKENKNKKNKKKTKKKKKKKLKGNKKTETTPIELHQQKHDENPATWTEKLEKQQNPHKSPVSLLYNNPQFILHPGRVISPVWTTCGGEWKN